MTRPSTPIVQTMAPVLSSEGFDPKWRKGTQLDPAGQRPHRLARASRPPPRTPPPERLFLRERVGVPTQGGLTTSKWRRV